MYAESQFDAGPAKATSRKKCSNDEASHHLHLFGCLQ